MSKLSSLIVDNDDDEPYSPGGSDEDIPVVVHRTTNAAASAPIVIANDGVGSVTQLPGSAAAIAAASGGGDPTDIQKKMEELNRQIEAQKMEIAVMLTKDTNLVCYCRIIISIFCY